MTEHEDHHHSHHGELHPHQLEPPHEVFHDPRAGEVARVWISNGGLSLSLHAMAFGKPDVSGHVLAGIAQQVAASCEEMGHGKFADNLTAIRNVLADDMEKLANSLPKT